METQLIEGQEYLIHVGSNREDDTWDEGWFVAEWRKYNEKYIFDDRSNWWEKEECLSIIPLDEATKVQEWQVKYFKLQAENECLRSAAQFAYRKHHLDDPNIGWDELSDILYTALCESMGDNEFVKWIDAAKEGSE